MAAGVISTLILRVLIFTICSCPVHEKGKIGGYDEAVERKEAKLKRAPPGAGRIRLQPVRPDAQTSGQRE